MTPVLETLPAAAPDLPVAPWGMLAAIDLHGATGSASPIPTRCGASCPR